MPYSGRSGIQKQLVISCIVHRNTNIASVGHFFFHFTATSEIDLSSPLNYGTPSSRLGLGTPRTPGVGGTPIRPRPDVRSERKMRTVNIGGSETVCVLTG